MKRKEGWNLRGAKVTVNVTQHIDSEFFTNEEVKNIGSLSQMEEFSLFLSMKPMEKTQVRQGNIVFQEFVFYLDNFHYLLNKRNCLR